MSNPGIQARVYLDGRAHTTPLDSDPLHYPKKLALLLHQVPIVPHDVMVEDIVHRRKGPSLAERDVLEDAVDLLSILPTNLLDSLSLRLDKNLKLLQELLLAEGIAPPDFVEDACKAEFGEYASYDELMERELLRH